MLTNKCLDCGFCFDDDEALYCDKKNSETYVCVSPLCWVGGKFLLADKLIKLFPEHVAYVEPFGGAAHVLFKKTPSKIEVYNDIDDRLVNFFRVVQDEEMNAELQRRLENTLYARKIFDECKAQGGGTVIDKAYAFAVVNKMSFGAKMGTWGVNIAGKAGPVKSLAALPNKIQKAFLRLKGVQIENKDFEYVLMRYDRPTTFFYLDPPYSFSGARGKDRIYDFEMTDADHERLVDCLLRIKGKAMLSGYDTPAYDRLGWNKVEVGKSSISLNLKVDEKRIKKTEFVWVNY